VVVFVNLISADEGNRFTTEILTMKEASAIFLKLKRPMMAGTFQVLLFLNGYISDKIGYRYTLIGCLSLIVCFTAIFFTAQTVVHLLVAEILCGIPWGVFQTLTITYASEVCPVALRGYCKLP